MVFPLGALRPATRVLLVSCTSSGLGKRVGEMVKNLLTHVFFCEIHDLWNTWPLTVLSGHVFHKSCISQKNVHHFTNVKNMWCTTHFYRQSDLEYGPVWRGSRRRHPKEPSPEACTRTRESILRGGFENSKRLDGSVEALLIVLMYLVEMFTSMESYVKILSLRHEWVLYT